MPKKQGDIAEYLEPDEMNRLLNVVVGDLYYSTLYNVLRYTGRRIGEIYGTYREVSKNNYKLIGGIQVKDIDFERNQMKTIILKTKNKKSQTLCSNCNKKCGINNNFCPDCGTRLPEVKKTRIEYDKEVMIPLRKEFKSLLLKYIKEGNKYRKKKKLSKHDYLFREVPLPTLKKKIKQHVKEADIKKNVSLHSFRRYFITRCKIKGISNEDIAKWTGHQEPATVNIYDSRISEDVREKIENVDL